MSQAVIQTCISSKRAAVDWRLRPRGHRFGQCASLSCLIT